jgi:hypothetical protein
VAVIVVAVVILDEEALPETKPEFVEDEEA